MSFPLTATVLDPLDGSGGFPAGFTANPIFIGDTGTFKIAGGELVQNVAGNGFGALAWTVPLTGVPSPSVPFEVMFQVSAKASIVRCGFISSLTDPTGAHLYFLRFDTTSSVNNAQIESEGADVSGTASQALVNGNALGLQWDGTTLSAWKGSSISSGWAALGGGLTLTGLTNPITSGWYAYIELNMNATIALNSFGGGTVGSASLALSGAAINSTSAISVWAPNLWASSGITSAGIAITGSAIVSPPGISATSSVQGALPAYDTGATYDSGRAYAGAVVITQTMRIGGGNINASSAVTQRVPAILTTSAVSAALALLAPQSIAVAAIISDSSLVNVASVAGVAAVRPAQVFATSSVGASLQQLLPPTPVVVQRRQIVMLIL